MGKTWGVRLPADSDSRLALRHFLVVECKVFDKDIIGRTLGYQTPREYNQQILNSQLALWNLVIVECKVFEKENLWALDSKKVFILYNQNEHNKE